MSEFKIKIPDVRASVQDQNDIAKQMKNLEDEILKIQNSLSFQVAQKERIRQRLKTTSSKVKAGYRGVYNATKALNKIANACEMTEKRLTGRIISKEWLENITSIADIPDYSLDIDKNGNSTSGLPAGAIAGSVLGAILGPIIPKECEWKFGTGKKKIYSDDENKLKETWYSKNNENGELDDSDIKPFRIAALKYENENSLFHEGTRFGDEDGSHISSSFDVLKQKVHAEIYGGVYYTDPKTGKKKLRPAAGVEVGYTLSALTAKQEAQLGNDWLGAYVKTEETVGKVEAKVDGVVGFVEEKDGRKGFAVHAKASAEAIALEATAKAGVKILGTDVGVKGSVNVGVGAHAEIGYRDGVLSADIGASLGLGVSVKLEVDIGGTVDAVVDGAKSLWNRLTSWKK